MVGYFFIMFSPANIHTAGALSSVHGNTQSDLFSLLPTSMFTCMYAVSHSQAHQPSGRH